MRNLNIRFVKSKELHGGSFVTVKLSLLKIQPKERLAITSHSFLIQMYEM